MDFANRINYILETIDDLHDLLTTVREKFPEFQSIMNRFGIDPGQLRKLASGSQGTAYAYEDLVVKITEDDKEARASKRVMHQGGVEGINPILYVGILGRAIKWHQDLWGDGLDSQFYVIVQNLQDTELTSLEASIATAIGGFLVDIYHSEGSPAYDKGKGLTVLLNNIPYSDTNIDLISTNLTIQFIKSRFITPEITRFRVAGKMIAKKLLEAVIRLYYEAGIRYYDVDASNVGKDKDGNYVIFDLGISTTKGAIPAYDVLESKNTGEAFDDTIEIID